MMQGPFIPNDVAEHLQSAEKVMQATVNRLERLLLIYGDGAEDTDFDDGEIWQWQVSIEHGEVEKMIQNLRNIGEFAGWLAKFSAEEHAESETETGAA
ncbi:MAG: hypothetical protein LAT78_11210 [Roseinatronobacter sp.]|nr:hypothetical protein [Roseinatronobacter sp.]